MIAGNMAGRRSHSWAERKTAPHERRVHAESPAALDRLLAAIPLGHKDWKRVVKLVVRRNNAYHATRHKGVSYKTMYERETFYFAFFATLRRETCFRNVEPRRLAARHVAAMTQVWQARGLSAGTLANYLSYLRTWCQWTGRPPGIVRDAAEYFGNESNLAHRRLVADHDHGWRAAGIDVDDALTRMRAICPYVAIQAEFSLHFAARPKEARCLRPHEAVIERKDTIPADIPDHCAATHFLRLDSGTKGGRVRDVPIETEVQWDLVRRAQATVPPGAHLGRPGHSLKANTAHYYQVLTEVGITRKAVGTSGHGLRHEAAANWYEAIAGVKAPVRGGTASCREADREARAVVARLLGHNRPHVASCYLGSVRRQQGDSMATPPPCTGPEPHPVQTGNKEKRIF